jgi:hypothetical protein
LSAALPVSALEPVPAFGVADGEPMVAPVLLVLRGPLLRLLLVESLLPAPGAPMLLLRLSVSPGDAPSFARSPLEAPELEVVLDVRPVDWQPAASTAASVTATSAAGRIDGLMSM